MGDKGIQCQVVHKTNTWPYKFRCKNSAQYTLQQWVRSNNPDVDAEFICAADAARAVDAFGKDCVEKL